MTAAAVELNDQADRSLLIVEDDKPFLERLSRAMETRGFTVTSCDTVSDGLAQIGRAAPGPGALLAPARHTHGEATLMGLADRFFWGYRRVARARRGPPQSAPQNTLRSSTGSFFFCSRTRLSARSKRVF